MTMNILHQFYGVSISAPDMRIPPEWVTDLCTLCDAESVDDLEFESVYHGYADTRRYPRFIGIRMDSIEVDSTTRLVELIRKEVSPSELTKLHEKWETYVKGLGLTEFFEQHGVKPSISWIAGTS